MRTRQRSQNKPKTKPNELEIEQGVESALEVFSIDDSKTIADMFTRFVLPRDKNHVLEKLGDTVAIRRFSLENDRLIFEKSLHLYLVDAALVCQWVSVFVEVISMLLYGIFLDF